MNTELLTFALTTLTAFIAIMNPVATSTNFIGIVAGRSKASKLRIAKKSCITAFIITVTFTLVGKWIFQLFGITIPAFKITGGILMFWIGFEMLMFQKSKMQSQTNNNGENIKSISVEIDNIKEKENDDIIKEEDDNIATTPIAIPILAGPGTLVTAMNTVTEGTTIHTIIAIIVFAFMITLTYLSFIGADRIVSRLGANMIKVISKIMGLILAIIGTGMIITGIKMAIAMP